MTPIGSTSSNIRRAIEFIACSSSCCCTPGAPCGHSRSPGRLRAAKLIARRRLTPTGLPGRPQSAPLCQAGGPYTRFSREGQAMNGLVSRLIYPGASRQVDVGQVERTLQPGEKLAWQETTRGERIGLV